MRIIICRLTSAQVAISWVTTSTSTPVSHLMLDLRCKQSDNNILIKWNQQYTSVTQYSEYDIEVEGLSFMLQAVGIIAAVGDSVTNLEVGVPAAIMVYGSYSEYVTV